ncbi:hypothetical protein D9M68_616970 [compost metagenome]
MSGAQLLLQRGNPRLQRLVHILPKPPAGESFPVHKADLFSPDIRIVTGRADEKTFRSRMSRGLQPATCPLTLK